MKAVKRHWKLALDALLLITLALLYKKQAVSMAYHEISGLALGGVILIHLCFNAKCIRSISARIFKKGLPVRAYVMYCVDALLFLCLGLVILSGVLISKVVFASAGGGGWKTAHYFCAALALILLGIHLGLHLSYFRAAFSKLRIKNTVLRRAVCGILAVGVFAFGCVNIAETSFLRWLSMPFTSVDAGSMQPAAAHTQAQTEAQAGTQGTQGTAVLTLSAGAADAQTGATQQPDTAGTARDDTFDNAQNDEAVDTAKDGDHTPIRPRATAPARARKTARARKAAAC